MKNNINIKQITVISLIISASLGLLGFKEISRAFINDSEYSLTVLNTNDNHGHLESFKYKNFSEKVGGMAKEATLVNEIKSSNPNVLLLDAGDFGQGTLYYKLFNGKASLEVFSKIGYDAVALGNHEFDRGVNSLESMITPYSISFLCANINFTQNTSLNNKIKPYIIKDYKGLRVGIIGVITSELGELTNNLKGVEVFDPVPVIRKITQEIDSKTDLIIVLSHSGLIKDRDIAKSVKGIDVIVGGHSHTYMPQPEIVFNGQEKVIVIQDGEFGVNLGQLDLTVKDDVVSDFKFKSHLINNCIDENQDVAAIIAKYSKELDKYKNKVVGVVKNDIESSRDKVGNTLVTGGSLVTNAIKAKFKDVDVAFQNAGSIRANRLIKRGNISLADVMELYPFENKVVIAEISGKSLKSIITRSSKNLPEDDEAFLQSSGVEYTVVLRNFRNTVKDIKVNGVPLKLNQYYKVAVSDFLYNGGNNYNQFKKAKTVIKTDSYVDQTVLDYLKANSPLEVTVTDKINFLEQK